MPLYEKHDFWDTQPVPDGVKAPHEVRFEVLNILDQRRPYSNQKA